MSNRRCTFDGCDKPYVARGWCHYHYHRAVNYGAPDALTAREQKRGCAEPEDNGYVDDIAVERAIRHGITGDGEAPRLTRSEVDQVILQMYDRGCTRAEMARATGYSVDTIQDRMYRVRFTFAT